MQAEKQALDGAITVAREAIGDLVGVTATDSLTTPLSQAITTLKGLIDGVEHGTDTGEATGVLADAEEALRIATGKVTEAAGKASLDKGKALYGKLNRFDRASFATSGDLDIDANSNADGDDVSPSFTGLEEQSAPVSPLGGWSGADYMNEDGKGDSKVTNTARIYSNADAPKSFSFLSEKAGHGLDAAEGDDVYTVPSDTANANIGGSGFPSGGQLTYRTDSSRKFSGTFMGASGEYACTASDETGCTATHGENGITLAGTWTFTPVAGATVMREDRSYLFFGWWLREDKDGPVRASAFYGTTGVTGDLAPAALAGSALPASGTATYEGEAAGKFAIRYGDNADAGHFTADAELEATFGEGSNSKLSGTIDNFRLNDGSTDPGWSVSLEEEEGVTNSMFTRTGTTGDDAVVATKWSMGEDDAAPGQTGYWEAQMFQEGEAVDGVTSNLPTTVVGKFHAGFGGTHKMVGAFGATR
ncbi:MAG: hypothetical protein OXC65_09400 [Thiotrichales bacterium]|nr:hypothetical protein [Thiotrichales bacterium]